MKGACILLIMLLLLLFPSSVGAQEKAEREVDIHKNVKLLEMPIPQDLPEEFRGKYQIFIQQLKETLKEKTSARAADKALIFQVAPGVKEVGSAKTKRPLACVVAYEKDSKNEFLGNLLLYSYATGEMVNKQEIEKFLVRQILNPLNSD